MKTPSAIVHPDKVCLYLRKGEGGPVECFGLSHDQFNELVRSVRSHVPEPRDNVIDLDQIAALAPIPSIRTLGLVSLSILHQLSKEPRTNKELQSLLDAPGYAIRNSLSTLTNQQLVRRIDGKRGSGTRGVYALSATAEALMSSQHKEAA